MIELKDINKSYRVNNADFQALKALSLDVKEGEFFGVIGESGAGKSTLVRCVNLLERPTKGQVLIDGVDLTGLSTKELVSARRKIGMIFQHFNLLSSRTAYQNVALPLELAGASSAQIKERVSSLLKLVDLSDRQHFYPEQLSGGQKQRVAIARALANSPKVLLCDEATSALDPESTANVLGLLKRINKELSLTVLLITHEMDVVKNVCDRVAVLSQGEVVEQGSVLDIFVSPQADETKRLTQAALHLELPVNIQSRLKPEVAPGLQPIVRLAFVDASADEPVISQLQERFQVSASILLADLEVIENASVGFTVCQLLGEPDNIEKALVHLNNVNIKAEVLGYA